MKQPEMKPDNIEEYIADKEALGIKVCDAIKHKINKLGFTEDGYDNIRFDQLSFSLSFDSFAKQHSLEGIWTGLRNNRMGSIIFHGDGSFYAEHDLIQPHPTDKRWFIEGIEVWGNESSIKTELKLLPVPE